MGNQDKTILLVDDEEGIRKVLGISLADSGYEVLTAENGRKALKLFQEVLPPIVLSDIKMPVMDGIELLKKIKAENPDTEVIMITGHGDMDLAIKSLKPEATDFITKPINDDALEIALKRANERIALRQQLKDYTENLERLVKEKSDRLIEMERLVAVGQAVDGLSAAMSDIAAGLEGGIAYFNEMPCFVSVHNHDLKLVASNALYRKRLGDKVGHPSWEIYQDLEKGADSCPAALTFQSGKGQRRKAVIEYLDGSEYPVMVHTAPIQNRNGEIELVLEIAADISEVKRLQEELQNTQHKYQQLFNEVPCYITVQDRSFKLTAANRQFQEDFDYQAGSHCYEVYKDHNNPCENCPVAKTFENGQSHQAEMVVRAKSGAKYNVLVTTAPIRNAAGEITQVMELSTNITEIRQLQDNLSSLGLMVGSVSHSIKGILTGLDAGLYLLTTGLDQDQDGQVEEGLEVLKLMVGRIRNVVLDILFYAKDRQVQPESINIHKFVDEITAIIQPKLSRHAIDLVTVVAAGLDELEADARMARSALVNVLENAAEACKEDTGKSTHQIQFAIQQDATHILFEIVDDGQGMDKETRENIFNLFFSSKGHKGTGLGLFIANKFITQHGGTLTVHSEPGKGSRFVIKIPKKLPDADVTKPAKQSQKPIYSA